MKSVREQLKEHLENGGKWEKMETPIQGVYIVKVPKTKTRNARLSLEINPLNEYGKPSKKKGLFISSKDMLIRFVEALNEDKTYQIIQVLDRINKGDQYQPKKYKIVAEEKKEEVREFVEEEKDDLKEFIKEVEIEKSEQEVGDSSEKKPTSSEQLYAFSDYIYEDRIYVQKIKKRNRDSLFIEVNQKDLKTKIFNPLHNLFKYEAHFFPKRFAILGEFKTGKTELGKYILHKMKTHFKDCITLTVNSKMGQYKNVEEIDNWLFSQWYTHLLQVSNPEFKKVVVDKINEFREMRGSNPEEILDKIYLICQIYKEYLSIKPDTKFIVEFDQANIIEEESEFIPFYEFWRNFQGYWENDEYFSELPIFIFVIGHRNWTNFAALKNPIGRGVFDLWVSYDYWNNADIEEMYKSRLNYGIKPEYRDKLINYFLCSGIIDYFGKKLGKASTQVYLDDFFGKYFNSFIDNFVANLEKYDNFLIYCKEQSKDERYDEKYFTEVEKAFTGNPAFDYMPVFRYLSDNQNEKWFNQIFTLISDIYEKNFISFESKDFRKFQNLSNKFIDENFTQSPLNGMKPIYNPPIFASYDKKITLNEAFRSSLETVEGVSRGSPVSLLQRFVKSKRVGRDIFVASEHGKKIDTILKNINQNSIKIFNIIQKWVVNQKIEETYLSPFYKVKDDTSRLYQLYDKNSTNWAIFDNMGRVIANYLVDETFPDNSLISSKINLEGLNEIRTRIISETTTSLSMAQNVNDLLMAFSAELEALDKKLLEDESLFAKNGKLKIIKTNVLVIIDGPNSLGENYQDQLDLEGVTKYAHSLDKNAELYYLTKTNEDHIEQEYISRIGYDIRVSHKDIDYAVKSLIRKHLNSMVPPNLILFGAKDQDYMEFIKQIRKKFNIKVKLVISSERGLSISLKRAFNEEDVLKFPKEMKTEPDDRESVYKFLEGRMGDIISWTKTGKICFPDREGEFQPNVGERWLCKIKKERDRSITLTLINKS
jgi:hypothetical protein